MNVFTIVSLAIAVISIIVMFTVIFVTKRRTYKMAGTMHVDMSREDKDICLFTLDMPLGDIAKEHYILMRVDGSSNLKEWPK